MLPVFIKIGISHLNTCRYTIYTLYTVVLLVIKCVHQYSHY